MSSIPTQALLSRSPLVQLSRTRLVAVVRLAQMLLRQQLPLEALLLLLHQVVWPLRLLQAVLHHLQSLLLPTQLCHHRLQLAMEVVPELRASVVVSPLKVVALLLPLALQSQLALLLRLALLSPRALRLQQRPQTPLLHHQPLHRPRLLRHLSLAALVQAMDQPVHAR